MKRRLITALSIFVSLYSVGLPRAIADEKESAEQVRTRYRNQAMEMFHRGQGHQADKKFSEALIDFQQSTSCFEKAGDQNRAERMEAFDRMGQIEDATGHGEAAEDSYRTALSIASHRFGTGEKGLLPFLKKCGAEYYKHRKFDEAGPIYRQAYEILSHDSASDPAEVSMLKEKAGDSLERAGNYAAAEPLLKECIEKREKDKDSSPQMLALLNCYSELLRKTNREAEADQVDVHIDEVHNKALGKTGSEPEIKPVKDASPIAK